MCSFILWTIVAILLLASLAAPFGLGCIFDFFMFILLLIMWLFGMW